jgi:hypothetical protein
MIRQSRLFAIAGFLLLTGGASAQSRGTAGIYGKVTDSQGAAVPGAFLTLEQLATHELRTTVSNGVGDYQFPLLPVGSFKLRMEHAGFARQEFDSILLQASDNLKLDATLNVGETTTSVTVDASAAAVETSNSTLKETVDSTHVVELPLNGRNVADLTLLVAGAQPAVGVNGDLSAGARSANGAMEISVNGSRYNNVRYTLDGGDNNDSLVNLNLTFPFPDAVQEFSFESSNSAAEIGRNSGGSVHVVTKSGTNEYHGDVFWFIRNTALNANGFFSRTPDQLKRNQAGFTAGGPVLKNKLFLFGGYQRTWLRSATGSARSLTMPAVYRTGDFSSLLTAKKVVQIVDPLAGGAPFPGNVIPAARISPVAQNILKVYPVPGPDGFALYSIANRTDVNDSLVRADYRLSEKHSFVARYFQDDLNAPYKSDFNNLNSVGNGNATHGKNATLGYTYIAGPALLADTHVTMSREIGQRPLDFPGSMADYGIAFHPLSNQRNMSINGTSGLSIGGGSAPGTWTRTNIELTHAWHWSRNGHNVSWGAEIATSRYNEYNMFNGAGSFGFDGRASGFDQSDFLLGYVSTFTQSNGEIEFRRYHYQGFYAGDTFRLSRRLSLNFGLRWEPFTPITDLNDREVQFREDEYLKGVRSPRFVNAPAGLFYPGDSLDGFTIPKAGAAGSWKYFAPRFGFAWDATGDNKTSLRGGYGIYYDSPELFALNNMNDQSPFSFTISLQGGNTAASLIPFNNPYLGHESLDVFPFAGDFDSKSPFQLPFSAVVLPSKFLLDNVQQWNLTLERSLRGNWLLRAAYVGSKSTHLLGNYDMNPPVYNPSLTLAQNISGVNARRPRQEYQAIANMCFCLNAEYNSLQVTLSRRITRGFNILSAYTWSKNIDYNSANREASTNTLPDPFNLFLSRGVSDFDHPQRWVNSLVWDLPDAGKAIGSSFASALLGHWQFSGILTLQSGRPFSITSSNNAVAGAGTAFGLATGDLSMPGGRSRGAEIAQYFNVNAVTQALAGTYGNIGRNALRGPAYSNFDASLSRTVPLKFRDAARLQFRAEFFNALNHPQLSVPNGKLGNATFGQITSTDGAPRILQFGLKMEF